MGQRRGEFEEQYYLHFRDLPVIFIIQTTETEWDIFTYQKGEWFLKCYKYSSQY